MRVEAVSMGHREKVEIMDELIDRRYDYRRNRVRSGCIPFVHDTRVYPERSTTPRRRRTSQW